MTVEYKSYADEVKKRMDKSIDMILTGTGEIVSSKAKLYSPVDTGRLRNSIDYETIKPLNAVAVGTNVEYADEQELGTSRIKAHPFLQPGAMNSIKLIQALAGKILSGQMGGSK